MKDKLKALARNKPLMVVVIGAIASATGVYIAPDQVAALASLLTAFVQ